MTNPYAPGMHLLIDFWGASHLDDLAYIEQALDKAAFAVVGMILIDCMCSVKLLA